jgi:hypothetical protein
MKQNMLIQTCQVCGCDEPTICDECYSNASEHFARPSYGALIGYIKEILADTDEKLNEFISEYSTAYGEGYKNALEEILHYIEETE